MLASIGVATAEIYFVDSLGGIFGDSSIAEIDVVTDIQLVQPGGTAVLEVDCEPDGIYLSTSSNGLFINFVPPHPPGPQSGIILTPNSNDDLAGNSKLVSRETGVTLTILDTNLFEVPTTVELSILCLRAHSMMTVGGIEIPTDMTALLLGYTILNSYWIAPTAVGIGLGIYLVKRKL